MGIPKPESWGNSFTSAYSYQAAPPAPQQQQSWSAHIAAPAPTQAPQTSNASTIASFFCSTLRSNACAFCMAQDHQLRQCAIAKDYLMSGQASLVGDRVHLLNRQPIPFNGTRRGLKASIDAWLTLQAVPTPATAQTCTVFTRDPLPHLDPCNTSSSRIEEVMESHILQVKESVAPDEDKEDFPHDIFEVFAAEKKKWDNKASKVPELSAPPATQAQATSSGNSRSSSQYCYQSNTEDHRLVSELKDLLM